MSTSIRRRYDVISTKYRLIISTNSRLKIDVDFPSKYFRGLSTRNRLELTGNRRDFDSPILIFHLILTSKLSRLVVNNFLWLEFDVEIESISGIQSPSVGNRRQNSVDQRYTIFPSVGNRRQNRVTQRCTIFPSLGIDVEMESILGIQQPSEKKFWKFYAELKNWKE